MSVHLPERPVGVQDLLTLFTRLIVEQDKTVVVCMNHICSGMKKHARAYRVKAEWVEMDCGHVGIKLDAHGVDIPMPAGYG